MSSYRRFDIPLVAAMALQEKQIQQNYRPIIAVHKWFARRPGTLFRALLLSEFVDCRLDETYFAGHDFEGKVVADPFMGGGSPLVEANRIGCDVMGFDINPMATWIVREEIEHIDLDEYRVAAIKLVAYLTSTVGDVYRTDCVHYGDRDVPVKYFLWVKTLPCAACRHQVDLFPGYLLADDTRHPKNVLVCANCGELNEVGSLEHVGRCNHCRKALKVDPAHRSRCACSHCGHENKYRAPRTAPRTPPVRDRVFQPGA